jgi:hypothetical protein
VLEAKIFSQRYIDHFNSHSHELPALVADIRLVTACSDVVVICQIDIETQFLCKRFKGG